MSKYTVYADINLKFTAIVGVEGDFKNCGDPRLRRLAIEKLQEMSVDDMSITGQEHSINFVHEGW